MFPLGRDGVSVFYEAVLLCRLVEDEHWSSASKEEGCRDALLPSLLLLDLGSADASQSAKVT